MAGQRSAVLDHYVLVRDHAIQLGIGGHVGHIAVTHDIEGAILIPEYEIADRAEKELKDKEQLILVYCCSGRRSKIAAQALADLGYTNVKEFGGIIDWQYEIVK